MNLLLRALIWWRDSTLGTALFTWARGERVGDDDQGNVYYRDRRGDRRWVIYNGEIEASRIPPEWHAWLHYLTAVPPSEQPLPVKTWEKPHMANPTGTNAAYHPPGSLLEGGRRAKASADYEPWMPG